LEQPFDHGPDHDVRLIVGQEVDAPAGEATAIGGGLNFQKPGIMGGSDSGNERVTLHPLCVIERVEPLDNLSAVERRYAPELSGPGADKAHVCDQGMPVEVKPPEQ